MSGSLVVLLGQ